KAAHNIEQPEAEVIYGNIVEIAFVKSDSGRRTFALFHRCIDIHPVAIEIKLGPHVKPAKCFLVRYRNQYKPGDNSGWNPNGTPQRSEQNCMLSAIPLRHSGHLGSRSKADRHILVFYQICHKPPQSISDSEIILIRHSVGRL